MEGNASDCSSATKELEEEEMSTAEVGSAGSSCEMSVEPRWRRQWEELGEEADDKEDSEQPEQRLLLNVPIRARHSSTEIIVRIPRCRFMS